jgi:hypothetical protein
MQKVVDNNLKALYYVHIVTLYGWQRVPRIILAKEYSKWRIK